MSFFQQFQKTNKTNDVKVKVVKRAIEQSSFPNSSPRRPTSQRHPIPLVKRRKLDAEDEPQRLPRKRATPQVTSLRALLDDDDDVETMAVASTTPDVEKREIIDLAAFNQEPLTIISASDITKGKYSVDYSPYFTNESKEEAEGLSVYLHFPVKASEEYIFVKPLKDDEFSPVEELVDMMDNAMKFLNLDALPEEDRSSLIHQMKRELRRENKDAFLVHLKQYNSTIDDARASKEIQSNIRKRQNIDSWLVHFLLGQVYARAVAPDVDSLRQYQAFSDTVYGELLAPFVTKVLRQVGLQSSSVFVDLGSGCGNVVAQAALEFGCESWGCEIMQRAATLASKQKTEIKERMRAWGIRLGEMHLLQNSFLESPEIASALKRADAVLVNNYAFSPVLNSRLLDLFLDLKEGCKIISLKTFTPLDHVIGPLNVESPQNLFSVHQYEYFSNSVSWTDAYGHYYISTKTSRLLQEYKDSLKV